MTSRNRPKLNLARYAELFRTLGSRGGKKRARNLTPERRREIARQAARTRWVKQKKG